MRAAKQGAFDALCGLYAIVNAIELVGVTGRRSEFHKQLFARLVRGLDADDLHDAICRGIGPEDLVRTARKAFRWVNSTYGVKLNIKAAHAATGLRDITELLDWIDGVTADGRHAVIISVVMPWLDHWTVAGRRRGRQLSVRDSSALKSLDLRRFTLSGGAHRVRADHSLIICRTNGPEKVSVSDLESAAKRVI